MPDQLNELLNTLQQQLADTVDTIQTALNELASDSAGGESSTTSEATPPPGLEGLSHRAERRDALIHEIERQSDVGTVDVDDLITRYHREYDQPIFMLLQDIQTLVSIYHNVFESLKESGEVDNAAASLKSRYQSLGLIPKDNPWPNPLSDWLMRHAIDKLDQYRRAMVKILRTRASQLLRELNFDPSLAVSFQLSLGTDTSFSISVQPELSVKPA